MSLRMHPALIAAITEAQWQTVITEYAKIRGWIIWHDYDSRKNQAGLPDLIMVRGPRLVFAELKTMKGRIRPHQRVWLDALQQTPAEVYTWRPNQWHEVQATLT